MCMYIPIFLFNENLQNLEKLMVEFRLPYKLNMHAVWLSPFNHVPLFVTLWAVAHQAPLSMGFPRQEHWRGLPCPPLRDLPNPGIKPTSLISPTLAFDGSFYHYHHLENP